ncbi:MAG TPA: hypothetical protein VF985_08680 [Mariniflexile sp.]|jgi:hypothetical protein
MSYRKNNISLHPKVSQSFLDDLNDYCTATSRSRRNAVIFILKYQLNVPSIHLKDIQAVPKGNIKLDVDLPKDLIARIDLVKKELLRSRNQLIVMMINDYLVLPF